jgi:hypothetical protein
MTTTIQIKRSTLVAAPSSLTVGELAYSFKSDTKMLYIGDGTTVIPIGGEADHIKLGTIETGAQVNTVTSVAGKVGAVTLVKADITNFTESDYVHVTGAETIAGNKTFSNNIIISGDLTVNGTVTHINSTTVDIGDNIVVLNSLETGTPSANAGLEVERGTSDNAQMLWNESVDKWGSKIGAGAFAAFALEGHTHVAADITDFTTAVNTVIGGMVLDDISNVVLTTPSSGQALTFNGTNWVNTTIATAFIGLTDAPSAYTGAGGYIVKVNSGATGLEFSNSIDGGSF